MTDRRASRDPYPDPRRRRQAVPYDEDAYAGGPGGYDDDGDVEPRRRRGGISPGAILLVIAIIGSLAFMAYVVVSVRETTQIPLLAAGATILAIVFGASAAYGLRSVWQLGLERGRGGRTMLTAIVGGLAAIAAAGFAALAIIGFMVSRPA